MKRKMKRKNFKNNKSNGGVVDTAVSFGSGLLITYLGGWAARGITKVVVESDCWQEKVGPWFKKKYNKFEDLRDEAIDSVKRKFKKN